MLDSVKISRRQSEIRQSLAELTGKETPTEDELRSMEDMDREYRSNETRYRAALIAEDTERRDAGEELETRSEKEWDELMAGFEMRQVVLNLDEGRAIEGQTQEIVSELRSAGGYRGVPVPWAALETRDTVSSDTPAPNATRPIIDRLFPQSVAARMGAQMINIGSGEIEWPVVTSAVTVGWASTEGGNVADPIQFTTVDRPMKPDHTMGVQMRITRKSLKQSGAALEQATRRDMNGAMAQALDRAVFMGTGADGQPLGVISGAGTYGIPVTAVDEQARYKVFTDAVARFMTRNAASTPTDVKALIRPELWSYLDSLIANDGGTVFDWDRLLKTLGAGNISMSHDALDAPTDPPATTALLTTRAGGVAPVFTATWGAVDLIRDVFTDAQSGGLRLTALATMDQTVARPAQLEVLTGLAMVSGV
ncbi:MAG: phage major capsid protein [Pseudomonadota bacterium]